MLICDESETSRHDGANSKLRIQRVLQDSEPHFVCRAHRRGVRRKHCITVQIKARSQVEQTAAYPALFLPFS